MYVTTADGSPLALAGLWSSWRGSDREAPSLWTCSIITTAPNALLAPIHNRMPAILSGNGWETWLDPEADRRLLRAMLGPLSPEELVAYPVSRLVNNPRNDGPELIEPVLIGAS